MMFGRMLLLLMAAAAAAQPMMPSSWTASVLLEMDGVDPMCGLGAMSNCSEAVPSLWIQDMDRELRVLSLMSKNSFAPLAYGGSPSEWFNVSTIDTASGSYVSLSGLCYPAADVGFIGRRRLSRSWSLGIDFENLPKMTLTKEEEGPPFEDAFGWLAESTFAGFEDCDRDVPCEVWELKEGPLVTLRFVMTSDTEMPVSYSLEAPTGNVKITFLSFTEGIEPEDALDFFKEDECWDPPTCEKASSPKIEEVTWYIFHPAKEFYVGGQDIADSLADAFFVCETLLTGAGNDDYEWISQYILEVDFAIIGQYQNCNGYPSSCLGENDFYVGKEAALGLGDPLAGQCQNNSLTGNWFSLPLRGDCDSQPNLVLGVDCTWRVKKRLKTIDANCLIDDLHYLTTCAKDQRAPFYQSQAALENAFRSNDLKKGGCPNIVDAQGQLITKPVLALPWDTAIE